VSVCRLFPNVFKHVANWFQTKLKATEDHETVALIYRGS
jgi:hypothetical protein